MNDPGDERGASEAVGLIDRVRSAARNGGLELAVALLLFGLATQVYLRSTARELLDSKYALLTSESLLERGSWDLSPYLPGFACGAQPSAAASGRLPWQLGCSAGRLLYEYPPGTPLLSMPAVALLRQPGRTSIGADGAYSRGGEFALQGWLAAVVTALTVVLVGRVARRRLGILGSVAVACVAAFGTSLWSTASRVLWSHSWSALLAAAIVVELLRWEEGRRRRPLLLGLLCVAAFWTRPTNVLLVVAVTVFVASRHRKKLASLLAVGFTGAIGYSLWLHRLFGSWIPGSGPQRPNSFGRSQPFEAALGLLFSPLVGVLFFTPVVIGVVALLVVSGFGSTHRPVSRLATGVVLAHLAMLSAWGWWWGGGPVASRFFTETMPLLAWLGAVSVAQARERFREPPERALIAALLIMLAIAGFVAHGAAATRVAGNWWRARSELRAIEGAYEPPEAIWNWSDSPYAVIWRTISARVAAGPFAAE